MENTVQTVCVEYLQWTAQSRGTAASACCPARQPCALTAIWWARWTSTTDNMLDQNSFNISIIFTNCGNNMTLTDCSFLADEWFIINLLFRWWGKLDEAWKWQFLIVRRTQEQRTHCSSKAPPVLQRPITNGRTSLVHLILYEEYWGSSIRQSLVDTTSWWNTLAELGFDRSWWLWSLPLLCPAILNSEMHRIT